MDEDTRSPADRVALFLDALQRTYARLPSRARSVIHVAGPGVNLTVSDLTVVVDEARRAAAGRDALREYMPFMFDEVGEFYASGRQREAEVFVDAVAAIGRAIGFDMPAADLNAVGARNAQRIRERMRAVAAAEAVVHPEVRARE